MFYCSVAQIARKQAKSTGARHPAGSTGSLRVLAGIRIAEVMLACMCTGLRKLAVSIGESLRRHYKSGDVQLTRFFWDRGSKRGLQKSCQHHLGRRGATVSIVTL